VLSSSVFHIFRAYKEETALLSVEKLRIKWEKLLPGEQLLIPNQASFTVFRKYFPDYPQIDEVIPSF